MTLTSTLRVALDALRAHKGRSALTSLGIVIGVGAVIALVSAGEGARAKLDDRLASIGKSIIIVRAGSRTNQMAVADFVPLTAGDADALRRQVGPLLVGVAEVQVTQRVAASRYAQAPAAVVGSAPDLKAIRSWEMALGRFYTAEDMRRRAAVCLLGETARQRFFPDVPNPVGQSLRIDRTMFRVVGVLAPKGRSATGADQDDQVFVPITTLQHRLVGEEKVNLIVAGAKNEAVLPRAEAEIERVLRQRHRLKPDGPADFDVSSVQELAQLAVMVTTTLQGLSAVIASVSLLVGGVGVMNIMLVAVTERTREIGLRMAVGAKPADVLLQFLGEAVVLALIGGMIGVTLGLGGAFALASGLGWTFVVPPGAVVLAFGVSGAVGVTFGFYPAWKASRLDPITALRYE
jgi:putative ABC transport system permease protein